MQSGGLPAGELSGNTVAGEDGRMSHDVVNADNEMQTLEYLMGSLTVSLRSLQRQVMMLTVIL